MLAEVRNQVCPNYCRSLQLKLRACTLEVRPWGISSPPLSFPSSCNGSVLLNVSLCCSGPRRSQSTNKQPLCEWHHMFGSRVKCWEASMLVHWLIKGGDAAACCNLTERWQARRASSVITVLCSSQYGRCIWIHTFFMLCGGMFILRLKKALIIT